MPSLASIRSHPLQDWFASPCLTEYAKHGSPIGIMTTPDALETLFPGDTAMAVEMRTRDWAATPLGAPQSWPASLRTAVSILLTSRFEMWVGWGPELRFFYNDAYIPTLGAKHPGALGRPVAQVWAEIYADVKDRFDAVMNQGISTWDEALLLLLERNGYPEETYHTFSYSPLPGDGAAPGGLICIVTEVTERVVGERRLESLRTLATDLLGARSRADLHEATRTALGRDRRDFPFAFLQLFDDTGVGAADAEEHRLRAAAWPFDPVRTTVQPLRIPLAELLANPPAGAWDRPAREALLVPVHKAGAGGMDGCLVLGLNPLRPNDPEIESFAELIAGQVSGALATVDARQSEAAASARLQNLFAQAPGFMAVMRGPDHRFELVNPAFRTLIGDRDVTGAPAREAIPEAEEQGVIKLLDRVYQTGEAFVGNALRVDLHTGPDHASQAHWLDFVYQPISGEDGVSGIFVQGIDVTQAHQTAAAARDSDALFRTFAQAIPNQLWTASPQGGLTWINDRTLDFSGLDREGVLGLNWTAIVHEEDLQEAAAAWERSLRSGAPYETEFRLRRRDGAFRWHLTRALPLRNDAGEIVRWVGTNTDINERKTAEAHSARELERVWTLSPIIKLVVSLETGAVVAANPSWTKALGWPAEETLGRSVADFDGPQSGGTADSLAAMVADREAATDREVAVATRDGGRRRIAWTTVPEERLLYAFGRDVTDLRLAEDALRQSQKMEAVGQLTGGIAHDFNNLLQGITGSLDLVQKRLSQGRTGELERFITGAMTSANRAAALTHRLLAFSRRQPLDPRPVRANPLVSSMEDLLRRTLGERVDLELVLSGGLWQTLCDPNQLENAVLNLAINARDAMPDGGKLTIETCNAHLDSIYAAQSREVRPGQYVCICVTDTGSGMDAETIQRAFEPFFTTKPIGQGTGLGLSMIYGFARQSEGYAKIYSEIGRGTTVKLYLPRHRGASDLEAEPAITSSLAAGTGETVLVVEDEAVVRGLIVEVLRELGYDALEAGDGDAGLAMLQSKRRIDLLITDMGLPGLNGRQIADAGRSLRPGMKVLFMTGYAENAALASGFLEPGMAMITKPFAMEALSVRVREIIEGG